MSLYGIDIASYQSNLDLYKVKADFVIVKVTEGVNYINPCCDNHVQQTLALKKKLGFYHYAQNGDNNAVEEASFFIKNARGYFGKGIPILDWEEATHDVGWALEWLQYVENQTGVKPMIYMSESVVNQYDWSSVVANGYGLWVAKYRDYELKYNYDMTNVGQDPSINHWPFYAMWQFTSHGRLDGYSANLDCNIFYGDLDAWDKYVGVTHQEPQPVEPTPPLQPTLKHTIGEYVEFGSCYTSSTAQIGWPPMGEALVPDIGCGVITKIYEGTNNPYLINDGMCFVNDGDITEASSSVNREYIVQSGDTLWDIAQNELGDPNRFGEIKAWNNLADDTIYPNQRLILKSE